MGSEAVWGWHGQRGWLGEGRVVRAAGLGAPSVLCIKSAVRQPEAHWGSWGHPKSTGILCDVEMRHWREEVHASGPRQHRAGERELWVFLPGSLLTWATGYPGTLVVITRNLSARWARWSPTKEKGKRNNMEDVREMTL